MDRQVHNIFGDFNTFLSTINRITRWRINNGIEELNTIVQQMTHSVDLGCANTAQSKEKTNP